MNIIGTLKAALFGSLLFSTSEIFAQQINYSGIWHYNKGKSDLSGFTAFVFPDQLQIKMTADSIHIGIMSNAPGSKTTSPAISKYPLDGEQIAKAYPGDIKRVTSYKIGDDRKSVVKNAKTTKADTLIKTVNEVWTLAADGKVLTISLTEEDVNQKPYTVNGIFEKQ